MYSAFASHCRQEYAGAYEILFGVSSLDDPALVAVRQLQEEFPDHAIRIIECPEVLGANGKVSNLVQMLPHAQYPYVVINDSDIVVSPHYLANVMAGFAPRPSATALSAWSPRPIAAAPTACHAGSRLFGSRMEALGISTDFFPGVLTARRIEGGIHFGLGSTLAVSREALDRIGGLAPLVDYLADDYELGARIAAAGYAVELSAEVVETWVPPYDVAGFFQHQLRWCPLHARLAPLGLHRPALHLRTALGLLATSSRPASAWRASRSSFSRCSCAWRWRSSSASASSAIRRCSAIFCCSCPATSSHSSCGPGASPATPSPGAASDFC